MAQRTGIGAEQFDSFLALGIVEPGTPHLLSGPSPLGTDINYVGGPGSTQGTSAIAVDTLRAVPFIVKRTGILNRIGINVTAVAAGGTARVGVYSSDPNREYYPAALLVDSGVIDVSAGVFKSVAINLAVKAGDVLWLVYVVGVLAPTITTVGGNVNMLLGYSSANAAAWTGISVAFPFAALPVAFPAAAALGSGPAPMIFVRYA